MMRTLLKYSLTILLSCLALNMAGCASTQNRESAGQYLDSAAVTTKIKALLANKIGPATLSSIQVSTYKGVVQLSGFVNSPEEIRQAVDIAKSVEGVKAVENSLLVKSNLP